MAGARDLLETVTRKVKAATYNNPLYRLTLEQGAVPETLRLALPDLWPGNAVAGQALIASEPTLFDERAPSGKMMLGHEWLRDLRAVGTERARRKAQQLLTDWLCNKDHWQEASWRHASLGERIANWISFHDFYAADLPAETHAMLMASLTRQQRHLLRTLPDTMTQLENLQAVKGLIYSGLALQDSEKCISLALVALERQLQTEFLADGGHIARNPALLMHLLRYLVDIRSALQMGKIEPPLLLTPLIDKAIPALKLFRHGDGGLALFQGAQEESPLICDALLTMSNAKGRVARHLPQTGYERVTAGRSLLLVDAALPAQKPFDRHAHAGLLAFEFSVGRERLITNCGAGAAQDAAWRRAMAATAAHSTLTLEDTNACTVLPQGGIGQRPKLISAQRYEQDGMHFIDLMHDGYAPKNRTTYHRLLGLSDDGEKLTGREALVGPAAHDFAIRWHIHPAVQVSLAQGGQTAWLRLPSGAGWRLQVEQGDLGQESSIYCGNASPRRTMQLRLSGMTQDGTTVINWVLMRERK